MSLNDLWKKQGKAEGIIEGTAKGKVEAIVELYSSGTLTAVQARSFLNALKMRKDVSKKLVAKTLNKIRN